MAFLAGGQGVAQAGHDTRDRTKQLPAEAVRLDVDKAPTVKHEFGHLGIAAELELEFDLEGNRDLNASSVGNESSFKPDVTLFASYDPTPQFQAFMELELAREVFLNNPANKDADAQLNLKQIYGAYRNYDVGLTLLAGRQDIEDDREWLFDEELDGVRVVYRFGPHAIDAFAARQNAFIRDLFDQKNDSRVNRFFLRGVTRVGERTKAGVYALHSDSLRAAGEDLLHIGAQAKGALSDNYDFWVESAIVTGETATRDVFGYAIDVGATRIWKMHPLRPAATLGFAFGSGDDGSGTDGAFRQTGIQDNSARFGGVEDIQFYGETLNPQLSNLGIITAGAGIRPTQRSSVDIVYHHYFQHRAATTLRGSPISAAPGGTDRSIGNAVDLVVGIRDIKDVAIKLVLGAFMPGGAFSGPDDTAYFGQFEFKFVF